MRQNVLLVFFFAGVISLCNGLVNTRGGNANGLPCSFPFKYKGKTYWSCISFHYSSMWCSTTSDYDKDRKWGLCGQNIKTVGGNANGDECVIPFLYEGKNHTQCTLKGRHKLWCSTSYNYEEEGKWGYCVGVSRFINDEERLYKWLKQDYIPSVRPISYNSTEIIDVSLFYHVIKVMGVNENSQTITLRGYTVMKWTDERLSWEPSSYGGVEKMWMSHDDIWEPGVQLYDSMEPMAFITKSPAKLQSNGSVIVSKSVVTKTHCDFDMTQFPFDTQTCTLRFGSWTYRNEVKLSILGRGIRFFNKDSIEFRVTGSSAGLAKIRPSNTVTLKFNLERKSSYYLYIYIVPGILLSFLAPMQFLLGKETEGKIHFGIGIILSLSIILSMVVQVIPADSKIPLLGKYYGSIMVLASVMMALSILLDGIHKINRPMSEIMRKVLVVAFGKVFCVNPDTVSIQDMTHRLREGSADEFGQNGEKGSQQLSIDSNNNDWQVASIVIHRFMFVLFFVLTIICSFAILPY